MYTIKGIAMDLMQSWRIQPSKKTAIKVEEKTRQAIKKLDLWDAALITKKEGVTLRWWDKQATSRIEVALADDMEKMHNKSGIDYFYMNIFSFSDDFVPDPADLPAKE